MEPVCVCVSGPAQCWVWLVDLERTVALLVGRCLGGMLQGTAPSAEEQQTAYWLKTPLFSNGLETDIPQLGIHMQNKHANTKKYCSKHNLLLNLFIF